MSELFLYIIPFTILLVIVKRSTDLEGIYRHFHNITLMTMLNTEKMLGLECSNESFYLSEKHILKLIEYVWSLNVIIGELNVNRYFGECCDGSKNVNVIIARRINPAFKIYTRLREKFIYGHLSENLDIKSKFFVKEIFRCIENGLNLKQLAEVGICEHGNYVFIADCEQYSTTNGEYKCGICTAPYATIKVNNSRKIDETQRDLFEDFGIDSD